jgi:sec-independent protein translocase protein TatA
MGISMQQILIILLVVVVLFGASRLPQIGEGMGKAIRNFKKSVNDLETDVEDVTPPKKVTKKEKESETDA